MTFRRHLAAHLRALAGRCHALAFRLDPPVAPLAPPAPSHGDDAEMDAVERDLVIWEHVEAGRIRRRRDESSLAFVRRIRAGDYVIIDNVIDLDTERARRAQRKAASR